MKRLILLFLINLWVWNANGQTCMPDSMYADSSAGVFPAPITMENPDGGIDQPVCVGEYYEYALTVVIPDSATFFIGGFPLVVDLISAQIEQEGAIRGLPPGIDYLCMPEDCVYPSETSGCILLYGTVEEGTTTGRYPLFIDLQVTISGLGTLDIQFPGAQFPGQYYLDVAPVDSSVCSSSSYIDKVEKTRLYPNPVLSNTMVHLTDYEKLNQLDIYSVEGRLIQSHTIRNQPMLDLKGLSPGMYLVVFHEKENISFQKMWIAP